MNYLGVTISFVIGGLLIVSILTLNSRVVQNSGETVLNMSAKETSETVRQIMRRDLMRIGYNLTSPGQQAIQSASSTKLIFRADVDNDKSTTAKLITWRFNKPGNPVHTTDNPNDYELVRTESGSTKKMTFPVTGFSFTYYDKNGSETTTADDIRTISVALQTQSPAAYDSDYSLSTWNKSFTPPNLKLQDIEW